MAEPTTEFQSQYPDDIDPKFLNFETSAADKRRVDALEHNAQEEKIEQLQKYIGPHPTMGWDPDNPAAPPTGRDTLNDRITQGGGTGGCVEQSVICNFSGDGGIDPGGLVQAMTGEVAYFVIPPTGWIPLAPPTTTPSCPPFPDEPPYPTPTPTGYPTPIPDGNPIPPGGYNPDTYPWPIPGFDPVTDDVFPMGPFLQFLNWGIGTFFADVQGRNAGNINFGPFGLPFANMPEAWKGVINLIRVFANTTSDMPAGAGSVLLDDPNTLGRASLLNVLDSTLSVVSQLVGAFGIEVHQLVGNGTTTITHSFAKGFNAGQAGSDHADLFKVISPDMQNPTIASVGGAVSGFKAAGEYTVTFDVAPAAGAILYLVFQTAAPHRVSQGDSDNKYIETLTPSPPNTFTLTGVPMDQKGGFADLMVFAGAAGGPYTFLENNGTGAATTANDYGTSLSGGVFTVLTDFPSAYGEIVAHYNCDLNFL